MQRRRAIHLRPVRCVEVERCLVSEGGVRQLVRRKTQKEVPCDKTGAQNRDRRNVGALPSGRRAPATTRGRRGEALRADASGAVAPGARDGGAAASAASCATAAERKAGRGRD